MHAMIHALEERRLFSVAVTDKTFGIDGIAALGFAAGGTDLLRPQQVLVDSAGRDYVVAHTDGTLQIQRTDASGDFDRTWAKRGTLTLSYRAAQAGKAVLDAAGRLVVLTNGRLSRYTASGAADTAFGGTGTLTLGDFARTTDVAVDPSNHVYVTGVAPGGSGNVGGVSRVQRYISRGKLDRAFQHKGTFDLAPHRPAVGSRYVNVSGEQVKALADGSVVFAGNEAYATRGDKTHFTSTLVRTAKFTATGALDAGYGQGGTFTLVGGPADAGTNAAYFAAGIRTDGAVLVYQVNNPRPDETVGYTYSENREISADGTGADTTVYLTNDAYNGVAHANFYALPGGREAVQLDGYRAAVEDAGGLDTVFNDGQTIEDRTAHGIAVGVTTGGKLLLATNLSGGANVLVRRYATA